MFKDYINELYPDGSMNSVAYMQERIDRGAVICESDYGFTVLEPKGDALIVWDIYVKPKYRQQNVAWAFHSAFSEQAKQYGKRVLVGFNQNSDLGKIALSKAGFKKAHTQDNGTSVYLRGV